MHNLLNATEISTWFNDWWLCLDNHYLHPKSHCTPFHLNFLSLLITLKVPSLLPIITLPLTLSTSQLRFSTSLEIQRTLSGVFFLLFCSSITCLFYSHINQLSTRWEHPDKTYEMKSKLTFLSLYSVKNQRIYFHSVRYHSNISDLVHQLMKSCTLWFNIARNLNGYRTLRGVVSPSF